MRVAVMGAGAVGCYYGGLLARAGHEVVLVGRTTLVEAVRSNGLLMDLPEGRVVVRLQAETHVAAVRSAQLVLVCVKSTDTEAVGRDIAEHLAEDAVVLSLQNGVDNATRLQALVSRPVHPAVVYVASAMAGAGHVKHHGRGELVLPAEGVLDPAVAALEAAGVRVERSTRVPEALWHKLVLNCAYNALSAITQLPYGQLVRGVGVEGVLRDVVAECLAVAAAEGVALEPARVWHGVEQIGQTMPLQTSSTAQDLARGRPSEIDHLNGFIVRRGEALKVRTPANRVLHALVRLIEARPAA